MHILVEVAQNEDLVVVSDWLALKELFGLLKSRFMFVNLVGLSIKNEAVRDPTIVASEDQDLRVIY